METLAADENHVTDQMAPATSINDIIARQTGGEENTPEPPPTEEVVEDSAPAETGVTEPVEGDTGGQTLSTDDTQSDGEGGQEEGEIISSFSQLVENQEWDPEWADQLTVTTVVNGETQERTIGELKAIDQTMEAAEQRLTDAKAVAQQARQEANGQRETMATEVAGAAALVTLAEQLIQLDEAGLAELKDSDPERFLILKDEIKEKRAEIEKVRGVAGNAMRELLQQITSPEMSEEEQMELARTENTKLLEKVPEWQADSELAQKESTELVSHAIKSYGFTEEEIGQINDHRLFVMARDAMLYRRQESAAEAARDKVLKIPRVMKGGSADNKSKPTADRPKSQILYPSN